MMKYFFLADGWTVGRVWEFGGIWNEVAWRRTPKIDRLNICLKEQGERLWLYRVEEAVLMVEVEPIDKSSTESSKTIGQVVLKRLITAEQAIEKLNTTTAFNTYVECTASESPLGTMRDRQTL
jgi:hypothetical protein